MSIGLQYGIPLPKLIASFIDTRFEPAGMTTNPRIRFAKSIFDYLFKVLDDRYYGGEHSGLANRFKQMESDDDVQEGITKDSDSLQSVQPPPIQPSFVKEISPKSKNLDAPPCSRCGSITQRNGSCYLCSSCGNTTGCS
jgi:ribonucleoside-diphosphate reductase alpha chain